MRQGRVVRALVWLLVVRSFWRLRVGLAMVSWLLCMVGAFLNWDALIERDKGIRWMPWHQEAMKDVARCEKPWGAASRL